MVGIIEGNAALQALKALKEIAQGLGSVNATVKANDIKLPLLTALVEAHEGLIESYERTTAALQRAAELENEIVRLKDWESERERYELKKFRPGSLAYVLKPAMANGEPLHMLCEHCYGRTVKSLLHATSKTDGTQSRVHLCPTCKTEFNIGAPLADSDDLRLSPGRQPSSPVF